ncbi:hypothetical protein ACIQBJ_05675 [Kitasatospora sp. NPDC088391]|uniref:hypothetical protein n=1 Tax=Kitasatospora sp. NPDC088391 TaxID=3364074 RepID=UPI0038291115
MPGEDAATGYRYAPADSLTGLIERGRGLGALRAREERAEARDAVLNCLRTDTRWHRGPGSRHHYLADLVRESALPIDLPIALLDAGQQDNWRSHGLLAVLARTGSAEARAALSRYVRSGHHWWQDVLDTLSAEWPVAWWDGLRADALRLLAGAEPDHPGSACWAHWGTAAPEVPREPRPRSAPDAALLLAELADPGTSDIGRVIRVRALADGPPVPELLPLVPQLWCAGQSGPKPRALPYLGGEVKRLGPLALGPARAWAASGEPWLAALGLDVLADLGTTADLPLLLAELERRWTSRDWDAPDRLADGLARLGPAAADAAPTLHRFWSETPHSLERPGYLRALTAVAPAAAAPLLHESLWDCERPARLHALTHAPDTPELLARAAELRDNPVEHPQVRAAAARR